MTAAALVRGGASAESAAETWARDSTVEFDDVSIAYRGAVVLKPLTLDIAGGRDIGDDRPFGLGQDDGVARRRRASSGPLRAAFTSAEPT